MSAEPADYETLLTFVAEPGRPSTIRVVGLRPDGHAVWGARLSAEEAHQMINTLMQGICAIEELDGGESIFSSPEPPNVDAGTKEMDRIIGQRGQQSAG